MKIFTHFSANNVILKEMPFKTESAMEAYIIENENVLQIKDDDQIQIVGIELPIKNGRKKLNTDGRIDLLAIINSETLGIIELKNNTLTMEHYDQLNDYFSVKEEIFNQDIENIHKKMDWIGILVGTDIDSDLLNKIETGKLLLQGNIQLMAIIMKRYRSDSGQMYIMTNTYISKTTKYDYSKYEFNGSIYTKGRLVHALICEYVKDNPDKNLIDIQNVFTAKLSGSANIVRDYEEVYEKGTTPNSKGNIVRYYFIKPEEAIELKNGQKIAVLDWWDKTNFPNILEFANKLNYKINKV